MIELYACRRSGGTLMRTTFREENEVKLRGLLGAVALLALPVTANAAMIDGQLDVSGLLDRDNSEFASTGQIDFTSTGGLLQATGDFASIVTPGVTPFTFTDIDFSAPGVIYSGGGVTFTASSFRDFDNAFPGRSFVANGFLSASGFDDTPGVFALSTQSTGQAREEATVSFSSTTDTVAAPAPIPVPAAGLLLLGGLGAFAVARTRKAA